MYLAGSSNGYFDLVFARRSETIWSILIIYYMISKKGVLLACRASVVWQSAKQETYSRTIRKWRAWDVS